MQCRALFFASASDAAGCRERALELAPQSTVADAMDQLCALHPGLRPLRSTLAVAVNERYVGQDTALAEGDVIALIPPVSGG